MLIPISDLAKTVVTPDTLGASGPQFLPCLYDMGGNDHISLSVAFPWDKVGGGKK